MRTFASAATAGLACSATPVPASAEHVEIVGAVADGDRVGRRQAEARGDLGQRVGLGGAAEDRLGDRAGEPAVGLEQPVGAVLVEAELRGDRRR